MKSTCYFVFNHSVLLCPNLYATNLHNSLRICSILVLLVLSTQPFWTALWYSGTSYNCSARTPQKTRVTCQTASPLVCYQHWAWREHRKHSIIYCCVLNRVYGDVAWQRVDQMRYNMYVGIYVVHIYSLITVLKYWTCSLRIGTWSLWRVLHTQNRITTQTCRACALRTTVARIYICFSFIRWLKFTANVQNMGTCVSEILDQCGEKLNWRTCV
jgi:hypothetical protein